MLNRAAVIIHNKQPVVDWVNEADPSDRSQQMTLADLNDERTVYLIDEQHVEDPDALKQWIKQNFGLIFESELAGWYVDPDLWPKKRSRAMFNQWFDVRIHSAIEDLGSEPLYDDGDSMMYAEADLRDFGEENDRPI